jgi:transposase
MATMARPLVSDELWELIEPLIRQVKRRHRYPGRKRLAREPASEASALVPMEERAQDVVAERRTAARPSLPRPSPMVS